LTGEVDIWGLLVYWLCLRLLLCYAQLNEKNTNPYNTTNSNFKYPAAVNSQIFLKVCDDIK